MHAQATNGRRPAARSPKVQTRQRLLEAARRLLEEGGYAAASVQAIAARAGVATGALYRHFPSKAELCVEVFRAAANRDLEAMRQAAPGGGAIERLEAVVGTFARRALANRRLAWALVHEPVDPLMDAERLVHRRAYCRQMAEVLKAGIAAGEIPEQNADLGAAALVGAVAEALLGPLSPEVAQSGPFDEVVTELVRFCRQGIGVRPDAAVARGPGPP